MASQPFVPSGATENIDVSSSSQRIDIESASQVRVMNDGTATVWIAFGGSGVTATLAAGMPIGPGVIEVLNFDGATGANPNRHVAAIAAGSTGKIYFTPGIGI